MPTLSAPAGSRWSKPQGKDDIGINFFESLILAQDECWRRALGMQVERARRQRTEVGGQIAEDG